MVKGTAGRERRGQTAPAGGHLQNLCSFLGALWCSGQTHCADGFRSGVVVPGGS